MPNYVYNYLNISGEATKLKTVIDQLNKPFVTIQNVRTEEGKYEQKEVRFDKPIISFRNIVFVPDDKVDEYYGTHGFAEGKAVGNTEWNWYNFNNREWGTKWDIAVCNDDQYNDTTITEQSDTSITYHFTTAWSPPMEAIENLAKQHPEILFSLNYEEEQGWGGTIEYKGTQKEIIDEYDIPSSHEDMIERRGECYCGDVSDPSEIPFEDCVIKV